LHRGDLCGRDASQIGAGVGVGVGMMSRSPAKNRMYVSA
jgi:hypothetical protein